MTDVHEPHVRSYNMSQIKGKNTKPEMVVRKFLHHNGYRYSLHRKDLPGKPDLTLPKYKSVIFIHGCFWHGHKGCKYFVMPKTRTEWWKTKISRNREKDREAEELLKAAGWKVHTIWECELRKDKRETVLNKLVDKLQA